MSNNDAKLFRFHKKFGFLYIDVLVIVIAIILDEIMLVVFFNGASISISISEMTTCEHVFFAVLDLCDRHLKTVARINRKKNFPVIA